MKAFADRSGALYILYRAAESGVNRDTMALVSKDKGQTFREISADRWNINACPMSTYSLSDSTSGVMAAWETRGRVYNAFIDPNTLKVTAQSVAPGSDQKHPFAVTNVHGDSLIVWTEGTGWQRGGALAWQIVNKSGTIVDSGRKQNAIPVWGLASAYARPDGSFVIVY